MNVLCFHIPAQDWNKAKRYWAWYQLMVASLCKVYGGAKFILLTHESSAIPHELRADKIIRIPSSVAPASHLHLLRVYGWLMYVRSEQFDDNTISVDTDVLFQKTPHHVFKDEFDIGLTYECIQKSHWADVGKINTGVVFLKPDNKRRVEGFFQKFFDKLLEMKDQPDRRFDWGNRHPTLKEWGGDEIALMALFRPGQLASPNQAIKDIEFDGARIRVYPSRPWNCQICVSRNGMLRMPYLDDVVIRHFTGRRKGLMDAYAANFLGIHLERNLSVKPVVQI